MLKNQSRASPSNMSSFIMFHQAYNAIGSIDDIDLLEVKLTNMLALVFPLPSISRFSLPEPFKGKQYTTWALIHGAPLGSAQNILLEGFIRPANWSYNRDPSKCDVPIFGAYYLGQEIGHDNTLPEWAARELMDCSQKRGQG